MRRAGWTLIEVMVAGSLLLLLLSLSSLALASYGRTLRGLQHEGDQMAQASHALERLQGLLAQSRPLAPGLYDLKEKPLSLTLLNGGKLQVDLAEGLQGQTTQLGDLALTYNQSQQIKTAQSGSTNARYEYDASGRRMAKEVNGEREEYLMLGQEVLKTFDGAGNVKADYFLGLGREGIKTNGNWNYYLGDGLGSTALLTDDSGNTVAAYDYEDYGATTQIAGDAGVYNPYRYTGQEWDAELSMYNLRARHYSPSLGRFLARDPIGYAGGTNLVAYCEGDPVNRRDPSGLMEDSVSQEVMAQIAEGNIEESQRC